MNKNVPMSQCSQLDYYYYIGIYIESNKYYTYLFLDKHK